MKFIAKKDCWFKEGTEATLVEYIKGFDNPKQGIFNGTYIVGSCNNGEHENGGYDKFWYDRGYKDGDEVNHNEMCSYDEFDIIS